MTAKKHYAWYMLFACCVIQGGTLGLLQNTRSIFFDPICDELGFALGDLTLYMVCLGVTSCLLLPTAGRLFPRCRVNLLMSAASLLLGISYLGCAFADTLPSFYILGALQGVAATFLLYFPVPLLLGNWFGARKGFATGIAAAMSGVGGMVMNPIGAYLIGTYGWRTAQIVFGLLSIGLCLPVCLLIVRYRPEEMGLLPLVPEREVALSESGITVEEGRRGPLFMLTLICAFCFAFISNYQSHLSGIETSNGFSPEMAAWMISAAMFGSIVTKVLFGVVHDHFGAGIMLLGTTGCIVIGFGALLLPGLAVQLIGCLFMGTSMGAATVALPIFIQSVFGRADSSRWLAYGSTMVSIGGTLCTMVLGYMRDFFGDYLVAIWLGIGLAVLGCVLGFAVMKISRRMHRAEQEKKIPAQ